MLVRFGGFVGCLGVLIAVSALPVSMLVNGDEIWTPAGQAIGNKLMGCGGLIALGGVALLFLGMLFDD